jgi:hypothetical protein
LKGLQVFSVSGGLQKIFAAAWNESSRPALFITMIFSAESRYNQWVREHYRFCCAAPGR